MQKTRFFLVAMLLAISFCGGCGKGDNSSKDPASDPTSKNPVMKSDKIGLTNKSFGRWSEAVWSDFRNCRDQKTAIINNWTETSSKGKDGRINFVRLDTDVAFLPSIKEWMNFVAASCLYNSDGIYLIILTRDKKDLYPEMDCIYFFINSLDEKSYAATIVETLDKDTVRTVTSVERNSENEEEFKKLDDLVDLIKKDSNYESRKKRWDGMWSK